MRRSPSSIISPSINRALQVPRNEDNEFRNEDNSEDDEEDIPIDRDFNMIEFQSPLILTR